MDDKENEDVIKEISQKIFSVHFAAGAMRQKLARLRGETCFKTNELEAIYHLVESHVPGLRMKTVLRFEKVLSSAELNKTVSKDYVDFNCSTTNVSDNVKKMLQQLGEMPSEWTLVQLTPQFNQKENLEIDSDKHCTNSLYISVFNCGENKAKPFCVYVEAPKDPVIGTVMPLMKEIYSIIAEHKTFLMSGKGKIAFKNSYEKESYHNTRKQLGNRLQLLVKDLQNMYLKEWRCFLMGRYVNEKIETQIDDHIKEFFKSEGSTFSLDEKAFSILHYLIKAAHYFKLQELKRAVEKIIPNKILMKKVTQFVRSTSDLLLLANQKRHPVILIIEDSLDPFPWEMIDILSGVSVSRLPSFHFAYALYHEHKKSIKDGYKIVTNPNNGFYIINPDLDLKNMENRVLSFYEYWLPSWKGVTGIKPNENQFKEMLLSGEIFAYNGHGGGAHIFGSNKTEKLRINAVVFLFGCGSTKMTYIGPQTEMYGTYQMYLIACSPCIVGNLWEVTDLEMDTISSELLSLWIPNPQKEHWKQLNKSKWRYGERVRFVSGGIDVISPDDHEPDLLKALSVTRKTKNLHYMNVGAIVARGIPIKLVNK